MTSNLALALIKKRPDIIVDPNNYYTLLGLDTSIKNLSEKDIQRAYRKMAKIYHPDIGQQPDAEQFDKIQTAYEVLSNTDSRLKYDNLKNGDLWVDKDVLNMLMKKMSKHLRTKTQRQLFEQKLREIEVVHTVVRVESASAEYPMMYYYEDEELPALDIRLQWIEILKQTMWDIGYRADELKVGFTVQHPHILQRQWGQIIMVSGEPDSLMALWLILQLKISEKGGNIAESMV